MNKQTLNSFVDEVPQQHFDAQEFVYKIDLAQPLSKGEEKAAKKLRKKADSPPPDGKRSEGNPDALVSRGCVCNLLDSTHGSHSYFKPTPRFYAAAGINPRRWAKIYRGELAITIDELKRLCGALKVAFSAKTFLRQLRLFD
jgi:hypothetical protein